MDNTFELDVEYNGTTYAFEGVLLIHGYMHKIELTIQGVKVFFEPDEERNYRALLSMQDIKEHQLDVGLIKATAQRLDSLLT